MDTSFVAREQNRMLGELSGFLSIPSVSALPAHAATVAAPPNGCARSS